MTRVYVLGQPYWASRIARALDAHSDDLAASFVDQRDYARLLASPTRSRRVVLIRAGYRTGATTGRGRLFDAYWGALRRMMPSAVGCHYWLGTDVMDTLAEAGAGTLRRSAVASARHDLHVADAPWLASELQTVGIAATVVPVPQPYPSPAEPSPMPATFRALTYLPGDRFDFYGGEAVMEAARRLPEVAFDVVGPKGTQEHGAPPNVKWHGWVSPMAEMYARTTVVIRIPRHDGMGATVIEGLLNGRHVIYSYQLPFVRSVSPADADALTAEIARLRDAHRLGTLALNLDGRAWALDEFDEMRLTNRLADQIRTRL